MTVCTASARTSHWESSAAAIASGAGATLARPRRAEEIARPEWATATPTFRNAEESERSRCMREIGSLEDKCRSNAVETPALASAFSKSIGLTLWGIVEEPTSPSTGRWASRERLVYSHMSRQKSMSTVLKRATASKASAGGSWGSIWVVRGFHAKPNDSTNRFDTTTQSTSG